MFNPTKFINETKDELGKVTWPTKQETIRLTQVVIIVSLVVSIYLGLLDFVFNQIAQIAVQ